MKTQAMVVVALGVALASSTIGLSHENTAWAQYGPAPTPAPTPTPPPAPAVVQPVTLVPLVTSQANPDIVNAWGLAFNATAGPAWIADNATGKSSVYDATTTLRLSVTLPPAAGSPRSRPTGIVFNGNALAFQGDTFVFVSEDGAVSGWQQASGTAAKIRVDNSAAQAVYKGATLVNVNGAPRLYVANFRSGRIEAFDTNYAPLALPSGAFVDPTLPAGYAPFNVKAIGNQVFVAYALQDPAKTFGAPGPGNGVVDVFALDGTPLARIASTGGPLNAPWGIAITPDTFGRIPHRLLVGNFGDGLINVYALDPTGLIATFEGQLGANGTALVIPGLWALEFAPNVGGFTSQSVFFTAGTNGQQAGLYGRLDPLP